MQDNFDVFSVVTLYLYNPVNRVDKIRAPGKVQEISAEFIKTEIFYDVENFEVKKPDLSAAQ